MDVDRQLSEILSEFAHTLVTDFSIQAILDHLVIRIVEVLPITAAGVTLVSPDTAPHYVAASDDAALRFEKVQTELGEGPGIVSSETGEAVAVADLSTDARFPRFARRALEGGLRAVFTFPLRQGNRHLGALDLYRTTAGPLDPAAVAAAETLADVTTAYLVNAQARLDLQLSSEKARLSSLHDALTGLPNRTLLLRRLEEAIAEARRSERMTAVLFVDLDRFKLVNEAYGHHIGDELLIAVTERLARCLRSNDTLARVAGDEFVVLCEDLGDASDVEVIAARVGAAIAKTFDLSGAEVQISASIGIAFAGRIDDLAEDVLKNADMAMYQAKRNGGARRQLVDPLEQHLVNRRANLSRDLRGALLRRELRTAYQPIVATTDGRMTGAEALLRWNHPTLGNVVPETIVALAEQSGFITEIGQWVLEQACIDRQLWQDLRGDGLTVAVNVSAHQFMAPGFVSSVADVLSKTGTEPHLLTLEVTESVFIQDSRCAIGALDDLKSLGVTLALDDFGTGYSSLSYLKGLPVDTVKIDRSFIVDLGREPTSRLIVGGIVGLAHGLGMVVVAEGVESSDQHAELAALGCDFCQGFYFARPTPSVDLEALADGDGLHHLPTRITGGRRAMSGPARREPFRPGDTQQVRGARAASAAGFGSGLGSSSGASRHQPARGGFTDGF